MPYLVTTKRKGWVSEKIVDREDVWEAVQPSARIHLVGMPPSGGTIGPLPDGTVIEIEWFERLYG